MVKQRSINRELSNMLSSPQDKFQTNLQSLVKQHKYRQAIDEIHKAKRSQPDLATTPSEAEIWLLRGKDEFQKKDLKQATTSLQQAVQLGSQGEAHYWLAKTLLSNNKLDEAIAFIRTAFEDGSLPKTYSVCYPKLLLIKGDAATVEHLLTKQAKRFPAAQQHWLRGVLALKANNPQTALESFQKVKQPVTPGDRPNIWQVYTQQVLGHWDAASLQLGFGFRTNTMWGASYGPPVYTQHPILQRLAFWQQAKIGQPSIENLTIPAGDRSYEDIVAALAVLQFCKEENYHDAAHALLKFAHRATRLPELETLRPIILTLAGDQAVIQGEVGCAAEFWQIVQRNQPFNPQLAVNLMRVLDMTGDYQEFQRLITRLIKWLEDDFKRHPENWPEDRRKATLAYAHCRLADSWIVRGRERAALGELQTAERIYPQSPEVKGRHGLIAVMDEKYDEATRLLTQALEEGCRSAEVYKVLLDTLRKLGNSEAVMDIRRRFGKKFGDLNPEADVEVLPWVDALSTQSYPLFKELVRGGSDRNPPMRACKIFIESAQGEPNSGGKVSLNQTQAVQAWNTLLNGLSPKDQVPTAQAIALSILLFAKREKGIAALITKYMVKLFELGSQQPEAREAHLVILALKERDPKKLQVPFHAYLSTTPQPGNALAQIQLQVRRYNQNILQIHILRPLIEDALKREPQNPLLLLAKATTFSPDSENYETFKQQGFEIARRVQDAKALKAFREEEAFLNAQSAQMFLPDPSNLENFDLDDMDDLLESMIRQMFGNKLPPGELKRMLPELKRMMMNSAPPPFPMFGDDMEDLDDEDEDGFGFGFPTGGFFAPSPPRKSSKRKRR